MKKLLFIIPLFLIFILNSNIFGASLMNKDFEIIDSLPLTVPSNNTMTQEDYTNFLASIENFETLLYTHYNDGTIQIITFNQHTTFEYIEIQDIYDSDNMNVQYNIQNPTAELVAISHIVSPFGYINTPTQLTNLVSYPSVINSNYSISNTLKRGEIFCSSAIYKGSTKLNHFPNYNINNFKVSYYKDGLKQYFTPTALSITSTTDIGVKVKVINGIDNIEEKQYSDFVEHNINEQITLTGKLDTQFSVYFKFYDKINGEEITTKNFTIYVSLTGNSGNDTNLEFTTQMPEFPNGSINPVDYIVYFFQLIYSLISMLIEFVGKIVSKVLVLGSLLGKAFSFLPSPIPELFIIGLIVAILMSIRGK